MDPYLDLISRQEKVLRSPRHLESQLQRQCVAWFRLQYPKHARLLFAVPNGGGRSRIEAAIMKAEGVTAGVSEYEIVEKINEIIRYLNEKEEKEAVTRPVTKTVTRL